MLSGFGLRTFWAIVVVIVASVAVFVITRDIQGAIVAVVGGVAAALVAAGTGDEAPAPDDTLSAVPSVMDEVLDAIVAPVMLVQDGRVTLANSAARTLLGAHILGEDARVAIRHPAAAERLGTPGPIDGERPIELVGLGTRDQRWEMRLGEASDGQRIVHLVDQTGNYAAERMRIDFVANASHELRTPLASILGFIETLRDEAGEDAEVRARFLKVMDDEARRMQRLVEDLISLSRIEAEKFRLPDQAVNLAQLVTDVCAEVVDAAGDRGLDLVATIDPRLAPVSGDKAQLSQMLHNLIGNAMKYGRAGTPVSIDLKRDDLNMIRLSIRDEGDGIAAVHIPRLTERFYRADAGRSRSLGGTGLGLAIVKHIVERHRGRLDIASQVGVGTVVSVILPPSGGAAKGAVIKG
ncbi:two-component system phosphate regulon sensor histidine kinase PhoR [Sphingomonas sp. PP-CE-3A-406]|uniref:ATP-binding protein n=1 Tax=unclassified Sphingomonas TaxID=196159 RepID=UPI0007159186|nr:MULTISPECIES: ATP-binding protein [unclassified Sphingomonas]KQO07098.1 ATPase [Sphingomonas sp. Leaf242]RMB54216.1 two-component system phosphate regulon sensor histidine kinase PhoR [Sphingomonas sp. PP-CE-3A-406]